MAWVEAIEKKTGEGRLQPTHVVAHAKVFHAADGQPVIKQACAVADKLRASRLQLVRVPAIHLPRRLS